MDPSPMVVEHARIPLVHVDLKREFSMLYVMEFGNRTLNRYLEEWDQKIMEEGAKMDPEPLLVKLVETLATFHKCNIFKFKMVENW